MVARYLGLWERTASTSCVPAVPSSCKKIVCVAFPVEGIVIPYLGEFAEVFGVARRSAAIARARLVSAVCWMVNWLVARLIGNNARIPSKQNAATPIANVTSIKENPSDWQTEGFMAYICALTPSCSRFAKQLRSDSKRRRYRGSVATRAPYRRQFDPYCLYIESEPHLPNRN